MRRINPARFRIATRGTSREINSRIVLNLVRARQPISRADLARAMGVSRAAVTLIVNELLTRKLILEGATGEAVRGRKPTFLYIDSRRRAVVAADIRSSQTFLMLADLVGKPLTGIVSFPTRRDPKAVVEALATRIKKLLAEHPEVDTCAGIGVVVPGMVEHATMRVLHAPTLGWRDVHLREALSAATGLPVQIENSGRACALAQMWSLRADAVSIPSELVFVSVSDGVGVGVIMNGEVLRGRHNIAGEFGHVPLSLDGPRCSCGANGCWEAYISNIATLSRYLGRDASKMHPRLVLETDSDRLTVTDVIGRARQGDAKALTSIQSTARYLGLGLANVVNGLNPARVYLAGEITAAWDLIEVTVRDALAERALTEALAATRVHVVSSVENPRLRGAAALIAAPTFAAIRVA
jgi:predicted NBD/HSP70 family sugar kinase/DNA-binding XRE family transcriptional regulator